MSLNYVRVGTIKIYLFVWDLLIHFFVNFYEIIRELWKIEKNFNFP